MKKLFIQSISKSHIPSGITPVSWLFSKYNRVRFVRFPISDGMEPVSWLFSKYKWVRLVRSPISGGMEPVSWLLYKYKCLRLVRSPISGGIEPVSPWLPKSNSVVFSIEYSLPHKVIVPSSSYNPNKSKIIHIIMGRVFSFNTP